MPRLLALVFALRLGFASAWADETALVQREVLPLDVEEKDAPHHAEHAGTFRTGERVIVEGIDPLQRIVISGQGASPDHYHLNAEGDMYLNVHKSKLQRWSPPTPLPAVFPIATLDEPVKVTAAPQPAKTQPHAAIWPYYAAPTQQPVVRDVEAEAQARIFDINQTLKWKRAERKKVLAEQQELDEEIAERQKKLEASLTQNDKDPKIKAVSLAAKEATSEDWWPWPAQAPKEVAAKKNSTVKKANATSTDKTKNAATAMKAARQLAKIWR